MLPIDFETYYNVCFRITDEAGNPTLSGFSIVTPENGDAWYNWRDKPQFKYIVKRKINEPGWLGDYKRAQIVRCIERQKERE